MFRTNTENWYLERVLWLLAGVFVLAGTTLAATVSIWWLVLPALVGANLLIFSLSGYCVMAHILNRACGISPAIKSN